MSMFNVFMNSYQQPENKLTYNLLCFVEHMSKNKFFIEFLMGNEIRLCSSPVISGNPIFGGYASNPDGLLVLKKSDGTDLNLYLENKTFRLNLTHSQIRNHVNEFCMEKNSFLLVITPRSSDKRIVEECEYELKKRIYFRTWQEIAEFIKEIDLDDPSFITKQFLEYGKISGEFENMQPTTDDIRVFVDFYKNKPEKKIMHIIENAVSKVDISSFHKGIKKNYSVHNHWGRNGIEFEFEETSNPYGLWFFFGIYYDEYDHGIPLKQSEPEIAFFLDINKDYRETIINISNFNNIIKELEEKGFEENILSCTTSNKWRLFFHRKPISQFSEITTDTLKSHFENLMTIIFRQKELFWDNTLLFRKFKPLSIQLDREILFRKYEKKA